MHQNGLLFGWVVQNETICRPPAAPGLSLVVSLLAQGRRVSMGIRSQTFAHFKPEEKLLRPSLESSNKNKDLVPSLEVDTHFMTCSAACE